MTYGDFDVAEDLAVETYKVSTHAPRPWPAAKVDAKPLGCGAFGCVYATSDKGVVVKITRDKREAEFAALALRWRKAGNELPPGIVSYHAAADLGGAWALWRASVSKARGFWGEEPEMAPYGSPAAKPAVLWLYAYKSAAARLRDILRNLTARQYQPTGLRRSPPGTDAKLSRAALSALPSSGETITVHYVAQDIASSALGARHLLLDAETAKQLTGDAKLAFQFCRIAAANIGARGIDKEAVLADALLWLWGHGIVLADPHSGNVGAHRTTGDPVIFDGWNGAAIEPGPGSFAYDGQSVPITPISRLTREEWVP